MINNLYLDIPRQLEASDYNPKASCRRIDESMCSALVSSDNNGRCIGTFCDTKFECASCCCRGNYCAEFSECFWIGGGGTFLILVVVLCTIMCCVIICKRRMNSKEQLVSPDQVQYTTVVPPVQLPPPVY